MDEAGGQEGADAGVALRAIREKAVASIMRGGEPDAELLDILTSRIVVPSPDADAVGQAMADIRKLAEKRAELD